MTGWMTPVAKPARVTGLVEKKFQETSDPSMGKNQKPCLGSGKVYGYAGMISCQTFRHL